MYIRLDTKFWLRYILSFQKMHPFRIEMKYQNHLVLIEQKSQGVLLQ